VIHADCAAAAILTPIDALDPAGTGNFRFRTVRHYRWRRRSSFVLISGWRVIFFTYCAREAS